jgi:hypothetical protein
MNERVKQLKQQAEDHVDSVDAGLGIELYRQSVDQKFAELIVQECIQTIQSDMDRETMNGTMSLAKHAGMVSAKTVIKRHFGVE